MHALVDSGATGNFVDRDLIKRRGWTMERLKTPLRAYNVDGSHNEAGVLWHKVSLLLRIGETEEKRDFFVLNCGKENVILGMPWLRDVNPLIDWTKGTVEITGLPGHSAPRPTHPHFPLAQ